ncbi:carbonic anhydrase [Luteibacter rhizovicinus DSM 16549]|uniref:Carbonic anhydrase n=1 Tax=Luteibacter rhizovicinus DSM 16549 TaxID=1440763 RepID=A0A0G9HC66_9GAMM|nr:carbonic anhydrase [Luteibacter rhizovicinus]APG05832.1 carbonic anhydrase [Luteibacter rhizovicinus DSM 16549]KLD67218.1 carbonic anhydrase [Luteibacter rhizovicinus DSM 16549]KLD73303.1 carbonic anhydrase [Xanthomonas hyacinthi DSM 19077]
MNTVPARFSEFVFSAQPGFDEPTMREAFSHAVPLKSIVIYCYDPRVREIPGAVAQFLGDQVYPGEVVFNETGNRVGSTTTMGTVSVAAGRAVDALRSVTVGEFLFGIETVVVVHHSNCGATSYSTDGMITAFRHEHGADLSRVYDRGSISITDYEASLKYDTDLLRASPGVPRHAEILGLFYNTDTGELTEVIRNKGE